MQRLRAADLRKALAEDAVSLHFQVQVHVPSARLAGVEGFVRWPHHALGMLGPTDVVPLVEEGGLHAEFDRWVVRAALGSLARWREERIEVPVVAVNVWPQSLRDESFPGFVHEALERMGADPITLELETPRGAAGDEALRPSLAAIRDLGVRLATDEPVTLETGLRFDTLKIPFGIVRTLGTEEPDEAGVRARLAAAGPLGARVVAESVETAAQQDALLALGCEVVQGYLYGPEVDGAGVRGLVQPPEGQG